MTNSIINVGLASYGMSGRVFHAPFIEKNPNLQLHSIIERSRNLSEERYPNARIVKSFEELLSNDDIELIIVNTPSYLHYEMTKAALEAGKHVVVEKPFTATVAEGEELIQLAKEKNSVLSVYHNKRLEGDFHTLKNIIETKRIGEIKNFKTTLHRYRPAIGPKKWKEERYPAAGILYDIGSHLIDQCLMLFGWPKDISADLQIQREGGEVVDYFNITFDYDRFKTTVLSDMLTENESLHYTLEGSEGMFKTFGRDPQEAQLGEEEVNWETLGKDEKLNYGVIIDTAGNEIKVDLERGNYIDYYQNICEVIKGKGSLLVTPESALDVIKVIEKITA